MTTVYRAADEESETEAAQILELLAAEGFAGELVGDNAPGVVVGTSEVRVPASQGPMAERLIASRQTKPEAGDASHSLDMVTIFRGRNVDGESEALAVESVLRANEIPCMIVGSQQIPSLEFEVQVPRAQSEAAMRIIEEARAAGPEAAAEAEALTEPGDTQ